MRFLLISMLILNITNTVQALSLQGVIDAIKDNDPKRCRLLLHDSKLTLEQKRYFLEKVYESKSIYEAQTKSVFKSKNDMLKIIGGAISLTIACSLLLFLDLGKNHLLGSRLILVPSNSEQSWKDMAKESIRDVLYGFKKFQGLFYCFIHSGPCWVRRNSYNKRL